MIARVERDGAKEASKWYVTTLETTKAFRYAYLDVVERELESRDAKALRKSVQTAYLARGKRWKDERWVVGGQRALFHNFVDGSGRREQVTRCRNIRRQSQAIQYLAAVNSPAGQLDQERIHRAQTNQWQIGRRGLHACPCFRKVMSE